MMVNAYSVYIPEKADEILSSIIGANQQWL